MPGHADYYTAAAALALGLIVIGITRWVEHRRQKNPMPRLVPTTPFMAVGALIVVGAIAFSLALWREMPAAKFDVRGSKSNAALTSEEIAEFKTRLNKCWVAPAGMTGVQGINLSIRIQLDSRGSLRDTPELIRAPASLSGPALLESAMQALQQCQPYEYLPAAKHEKWKVLDLVFSPEGLSEVSAASAYKDLRLQ